MMLVFQHARWPRETLIATAVTLLLACYPHITAIGSETPADQQQSESQPDELIGVGIALRPVEGGVEVFAVIPNGPAALSEEIHVGDIITAVANGDGPRVRIDGMPLEKVVDLIRGPEETEVWLTITPKENRFVKRKIVSLLREGLQGARLVGKRVPDAELTKLFGETRWSTNDTAGRLTVIEFWAPSCPPCVELVQELQEYWDRYPQWHAKVLLCAVNLDEDVAAARQIVSENGWTGINHLRGDDNCRKAFDAHILPLVVIVDQSGTVTAAGSPRSINLPRTVERLLSIARQHGSASNAAPNPVEAPRP